MNRKQWYVLGIFFILLAMLFMYMSLQWKGSCNPVGEVEMSNIVSCVKGEIFSPYPYIFFGLGVLFQILAWLEPKR
jgi:hypothetical protein